MPLFGSNPVSLYSQIEVEFCVCRSRFTGELHDFCEDAKLKHEPKKGFKLQGTEVGKYDDVHHTVWNVFRGCAPHGMDHVQAMCTAQYGP